MIILTAKDILNGVGARKINKKFEYDLYYLVVLFVRLILRTT